MPLGCVGDAYESRVGVSERARFCGDPVDQVRAFVFSLLHCENDGWCKPWFGVNGDLCKLWLGVNGGW